MGKDPNSAIAAHSQFLWLCGHKSRTLREKNRTIFHFIVTKYVEDEERTFCILFRLFLLSRHAGCSGGKVIPYGLSVTLGALISIGTKVCTLYPGIKKGSSW